MLFFLSKLLPLLLLPIGLTALLLILGFILQKKPRLSHLSFGIGLLVLLLSSNTPVALRLAKTLEWQHIPQGPFTKHEVIVVLGGGTTAGYYPQPTAGLNEAGDRLLYAADLYQQGIADQLLITGGTLPGDDSSEADEMAQILGIMGVPHEALILEDQALNTYDNGRFSKAILEERNINKIILITSAMHMPRAKAVFEKQGFFVTPAPTDFYVQQAEWSANRTENLLGKTFDFIPNGRAITISSNAVREYMGLVVYRLRGWI